MEPDFEPNGDCLLTGHPAYVEVMPGGRDVVVYTSKPCGTYELTGTLAASKGLWQKHASKLNLMAGLVRKYSDAGKPLSLLTQHLSDEELIDALISGVRPPADPLEQIDELILQVFERAGRAATSAYIRPKSDYTLIFAEADNELEWVIEKAEALGLIETEGVLEGLEVELTIPGWQHVKELKQNRTKSVQAFVAIAFSPALEEAWKEGIEPALTGLGWRPIRVDGIEHNEKIDDLIIAEIKRSGLVVADFTEHRQNVYFEAGFARGLGLPVIWTCHADHISSAHFDTRQFNHVVWKDPADLQERLRLRILATIPTVGVAP